MKIEISKNPDRSITISGSLTEHEMCNIYCNASDSDGHKLHIMYDLAESSKRMSDYLMWISELVRIEEHVAYMRKIEEEKDVS